MKSTKTKERKPKLNVSLLRKIQKHILEEPKRFLMRTQLLRGAPGETVADDDYCYRHEVPKCGTIACIAGWALLLSKRPITEVTRWSSVSDRASDLVGVTRDDPWKHRLFQQDGWPKRFAARYERAKTPSGRAKVAVARIEHLITKGE